MARLRSVYVTTEVWLDPRFARLSSAAKLLWFCLAALGRSCRDERSLDVGEEVEKLWPLVVDGHAFPELAADGDDLVREYTLRAVK